MNFSTAFQEKINSSLDMIKKKKINPFKVNEEKAHNMCISDHAPKKH